MERYDRIMEYEIYRDFTERFWNEPQTYEDLSDYLSENHISNIANIAHSKNVTGQLNGLHLKVTFWPTSKGKLTQVKTAMRGRITISDFSDGSQRKATEVLTLLAQYMPSHLRK